MKRIALFLMIVILGTASFAAKPKALAAKAPAAAIPAPIASEQASDNALRLGVLNLSNPGGFVSVATVGKQINAGLSGDLGLAIGQNAAGSKTNIGILARLEFVTPKIGEVNTFAAGNLWFATDPTYAGGASSITLNISGGLEYPLLKNLSFLVNATLFEITSFAGTTAIGIGAGTANTGGSGLGVASIAIYNGIRLYL